MKNFLQIFSLICVATLVVFSSYANTTLPYKITGGFVYIEPAVEEEPSEVEADAPEAPPREPVDLSNATLTISYETTNEEGEAETVTLYEGPYEEDFENVGEVAEPTRVKIALQLSEDSEPMTINTVVGTNSDVQIAYLDRPGPNDQFLLVGSTNQVLNPKNRFTVSGDLSFLGSDITSMATVYVTAMFYNDQGQPRAKRWGPILLENDAFLIEGDIERPMTARFDVDDLNEYWSSTELIIEPRGEIVVSQLGTQTEELSMTSGYGYHAMLIESWQQDKNYIALSDAYVAEYENYRKRRAAGEPEPDTSDAGDSDVAASETDAEESTESEMNEETVTPAEGCEDAVAETDETESSHSSNFDPKWWSLSEKMSNIRSEILRTIAEGDGDPMARFLAIEMNPYEWNAYGDRLAVLLQLTKEFDKPFVESNINPIIERLERSLMLVNNDAALIPGQKVPEFVLVNYDGEDKSLYDLIADKDMVLIDFWASWCGPCIADFPELKKLYAAYTDEDFEIVGVSIDSTEEAWKGGVDEHELPWTNLGELKGWEGPIATMYGVNAIPKGFLVDSQGCIYTKSVRPAALKEFLVDRYGMDESLEEPEEIEDSPDVSS
ncbi:MAG: TlpA disulfide reductase family protein [Gammaproteobacteria bacterium]|nr:TlpA disulfide reductase family protein [Gammaproteobacteria bacterium]